MDDRVFEKKQFVFRVTASHLIAYGIAGLFAVSFMDYAGLYSVPPLSYFMRQVDSPVVALGPVLQIFRGAIIAFIFWFFREPLLGGRHGYLKIFILVTGLSYISTIGPSIGSFEGYVYTTFPIKLHLTGVPEMLIYSSLFSLYLFFWYRLERKVFTVSALIFSAVLVASGILGYLRAVSVI